MKKFQNKFNLKKKKNLNKFKYSENQLNKLESLVNQLNYKNILLLRNYITVSGKIIPKRLNNLTATQQRQLTRAIKNARLLSFLPFVRLIEL